MDDQASDITFSQLAMQPEGAVQVNLHEFRRRLPELVAAIQQALFEASGRIPLSELKIRTLDPYFTLEPELLSRVQIVVVDRVPEIPFERYALPDMARLFPTSRAGVAFGTLIFIQESFAVDESLYFHELVHLLQMEVLGIERFLDIYVTGLVLHGYKDNPLERAALQLQNRFDGSDAPFHLPAIVRKETREIEARFRKGTL